MGGQTRNIPVITLQLQDESPSSVRFNLFGKEEDTPGISANSPLTIAAARDGDAWVFYWEEDHLLNLFSFIDGKPTVSIVRMSEDVVNKLRGYRETLTQPFKRGEGLPDKCTRVYRLPLPSNSVTEHHEVRILAYHFPDTKRDYLRLNFLKQKPGTNDWDIEPIVEIRQVYEHPSLVTGLLLP